MKTRIEFEVETLLVMLQAGVDALDQVDSQGGLGTYGMGYKHAKMEVIEHLDRILKEVSE